MMSKSTNNPEALEAQTQVFKILSHPARIAILNLLRDGEHCVCHLEAHLGFRQSYISQQLAVLREAGMIQDRRDGWNIYYRVVKPSIFAVLDAVQEFTGWQTVPAYDKEVICRCPHCAVRENGG